MDREILFRGKTKDGRWLYGDLVKTEKQYNKSKKDGYFIITGARHNGGWLMIHGRYPVDPTTVGQFTGLCDDKERKVFEGDIVDVRGRFKSEVRYVCRNTGFLIKDNYGNWEWLYDVLASMHCEVIGNIHDNPELVEEEAE